LQHDREGYGPPARLAAAEQVAGYQPAKAASAWRPLLPSGAGRCSGAAFVRPTVRLRRIVLPQPANAEGLPDPGTVTMPRQVPTPHSVLDLMAIEADVRAQMVVEGHQPVDVPANPYLISDPGNVVADGVRHNRQPASPGRRDDQQLTG
jgi:hypothetical protein